MNANTLPFLPRDTRDFSAQSIALRRHLRMKGKSLKHILLDRFLNHYGYDKGAVTASAIIDDLLQLVEHYYRYTDNSFLKHGQMVWLSVPINEYPAKGKSMAHTKLSPVVLDIVTDDDIEDMKSPLHHREVRLKKVERWTQQAFDQGGLLSQLDLAVLLTVNESTASQYVREYHSLFGKLLPTRGNIQLIGSGQTHKKEIITLYLKGYLVPTICQRTHHSKESVERYIRDFEAVKLLSTKFDDPETISRLLRLSPSVVKQYIDLLPLDS
jgi:predicted transcriptional regulator